ncbi:multidrug efflux SMR transporter [Brevibacterium sp. HMSC063G07]|uniref:DMT family transporter n=1 Tax=Brevibacterium sp. HMSC063G07 TaxID=1739261 RepID=UPI0008A1574A|nr:SMR family transporter [Brevibacterium sp. HMSC063G07]OFL68886.1 cation transporter [Brevibacterium sp. HMSC063G07]
MTWVFLGLAIVTEIAATMFLRLAAFGRKRWYIPVGIGYAGAFFFLSLALAAGMPLSVGYGLWSAIGVAATAVLAALIFKEPLTLAMGAGIALICTGVLLVELGA